MRPMRKPPEQPRWKTLSPWRRPSTRCRSPRLSSNEPSWLLSKFSKTLCALVRRQKLIAEQVGVEWIGRTPNWNAELEQRILLRWLQTPPALAENSVRIENIALALPASGDAEEVHDLRQPGQAGGRHDQQAGLRHAGEAHQKDLGQPSLREFSTPDDSLALCLADDRAPSTCRLCLDCLVSLCSSIRQVCQSSASPVWRWEPYPQPFLLPRRSIRAIRLR